MKIHSNTCAIFCFIVATCFFSCTKSNPSVGGKGGTATLTVLPQHHTVSKNIDTCKLYIKYNATDAPVTYDDSTTCICASGVVTCTFANLKNGNYYLYGYGYDTSISSHVHGGLYTTIVSQAGSTTVALPVSE